MAPRQFPGQAREGGHSTSSKGSQVRREDTVNPGAAVAELERVLQGGLPCCDTQSRPTSQEGLGASTDPLGEGTRGPTLSPRKVWTKSERSSGARPCPSAGQDR